MKDMIEEASASKEYEFETLKYKQKTKKGETEIVKLTRKNVALAEAMVRNDSKYRNASDPTKGPIGKYNGSSAYWASKLEPCLKNEIFDDGFDQLLWYYHKGRN